MSELYLVPFPGDSANNVNGVAKGTPVFIFDYNTEPEFTYTTLDPKPKQGTTADVLINYQYIKRELNMMEVEENLKSTIMWKYSQKKAEVDVNTKVKEDYLIKKFHEIVKCHNKICFFFLSNLHSLLWRVYSKGDDDKYTACVLSTIDLHESIQLLKPATQSYYNILLTQILKKYPDDLSSSAISNIVEKQTMELKHKGLLDMKNVKNLKKSKNK